MKSFDYAVAKNVSGAMAATEMGYKIKASGIDLLDMMKNRIEESDKLVSIHRLKDLKGIRMVDGALVVNALATLNDIAMSPEVQKHFPALGLAAGEAATPQVRHRATAAGNICQRPRCWYFRSLEYHCLKKGGATCYAVDGENRYHALFGGGPCHIVHPSNIAPALVAANAEIVVGSGGKERIVPAKDFFQLPVENLYGENILEEEDMVTAIRIADLPSKSAYVEFREKQSFDWPVAAAVAGKFKDGWRVALGAVAPVPWVPEKTNETLKGKEAIDEELAEKAADAALDKAEPMEQNAWRKKLVRAAVRRALLKADGKEIG